MKQGSTKLENSRSGPKIRILDRLQTPQNANNSVQQVCALNPIFPQPTYFHESMMSKQSQTVKSSQTDNVRTPFKCDIMVAKWLKTVIWHVYWRGQMNNSNLPQHKLITSLSKHCQKINTVLFAVNKQLTRIISNGSLIINPFVWQVLIHWDCKTPVAVGMSKRSKVALILTESD